MSKSKLQPTLLQKINFIPDTKWTVIGIAILIASSSLLFYNAFFGLGVPDEAFYLTIPYRIIKGDAIFINEWHASLLVSALQHPFVLLFTKLTGSGEGIILFFRLLFVLFQVAVSLFAFTKLKKRGFTTALVGSLLFELYVPEYLLSLDYYTLSLLPLTVIALSLIFEKKMTPFKYIFCGVLFACAVLAEPILSLAYFALFIAVVILTITNKTKKRLFNFKSFFCFSTGIAFIFALFVVFILSQESIPEFLHAVKNIFRTGEYSSGTFLQGYLMYAGSLFRDYSWATFAAAVYLAVILIDRKRQSRKLFWTFTAIIIAIACAIISAIKITKGASIVPLVNLPFIIAFLGISSFILQKNKDYKLLYLWLVGFFYAILLFITSVAADFSGSYGFSLSNIASVSMFINLCHELSNEIDGKKTFIRERINRKEETITVYSVCAAVFAILFFCLCGQTYALLLRDTAGEVLGRGEFKETVLVETGAYKGIRITPEQNQVYNDILEDIDYIEKQTDGKYTVLSDNSWYLFSSDRAPLAFTLWYIDEKKEYYLEYYNYLEEMPDYIFIVNKNLYSGPAGSEAEVNETLSYFISKFNCVVTEGKAGYILKVDGIHES